MVNNDDWHLLGKRQDPDYRPTDPVKFQHVDELLKLMTAITRDNRFVEWLQEGEEKTRDMDAFLDRVEEKGRQEGRQEGFLEALAGLVKKGLLSLSDAAKEANLTPAEFQERTARYIQKS